ncbi:MAG: hypothetical protein H7A35_03065 [Planctomycetales bacterium]|nr:hypothetical protein [bacterium]UNM09038.1 MAG: hypothetical protein H7A35_03065 [Planctomycetales bacterium]
MLEGLALLAALAAVIFLRSRIAAMLQRWILTRNLSDEFLQLLFYSIVALMLLLMSVAWWLGRV